MTVPIATYRLQLRNGFGFADAANLAPYLAKLGISHVYLSPIFRAAPGSTHGYDAVDFNEVDPLLGGIDGFDRLVAELNRFGLKAIVDFVPNHMAAHPDNAWWHDILEWGQRSHFSRHFDIDWTAPKLLRPILGKQYGESLSSREIAIAFEPGKGAFVARYFDNWLPLAPTTYSTLLAQTRDPDFDDLARAFAECSPEDSRALKARLASLAREKHQLIENALRQLNDKPAEIHSILQAQPWRLAYWRTAREMLTYRRFFEISDLVGVRVEQPDVFADVHRTVLELVKAGKIDGLRIDHIDGLADPKDYLEQLRKATASTPDLYLVVEKILGHQEDTRADWPMDGTTGYEFIRDVGNLFVTGDLSRLDRGYRDFTSSAHDYASEVLEVKRRTLSFNLAAELTGLVATAAAIADEDIATRDFGSDALRIAIIEFASHFAVYRTYLDSNGPSTTDGEILETVARRAKASRRIEDPSSVDFLVSLLSGRVPTAQKAQAAAFTTRFQQTTGPLMAKAVEDTEFYRFNRLIALNEVGGEPDAVSPGAEQFHMAMARRQMLAPRALTATATHDTKRGEDARVRLYALSTIQDEWCEAVERWSAKLSGPSSEAGQDAPDREAQWLFFQALAGAWPTDETASDDLDDRMVQFMIKASREAKLFSSWTNPDPSYETRIASFVQYALDPANGFVDDFKHMIEPLIKAGAATSLVQTVLKVFAPGVPDIYQGTELWDLSLVDPDNRRPVDFEHRQRLISNAPQELLVDEAAWRDGSLKLDLLRRSLAVRRQMDFTKATYEPLQMTGGDSERAFAFARRARDRTVIVIGARASPKDYQGITGFGFDNALWHGTQIAMPPDLKNHHFVDVFSGTTVPVNDQTIEVAAALRCLPVAVLSSAS